MSSNYGRKGHEVNSEERLIECYADYIVSRLKRIGTKQARELEFERLTKNQTDKEKIRRLVFTRWKT